MSASATPPERDNSSLPEWSAVIINWNGTEDLPACLAALTTQAWPATEIVVVDNASADNSLSVLAGFPTVRVLANSRNLGFAGGANQGIRSTSTPLVATLNPDVTLDIDWSQALCAAFASDEGLGAAGGKLWYLDRTTLQHAGGRIEFPLLVGLNIGRGEVDRGQYDQSRPVDFVTGGALMLRRAAIDEIGGFDEAFYPAYYEDLDLCVRLRALGWQVRYIPAATGVHRESASVDEKGAAYFRMIHGGRLRFASKHLSLPELVTMFLPAEVERLASTLQHVGGPAASAEAGLDVFPLALLHAAATSTGLTPAPRAGAARAEQQDNQVPGGELREPGQLAGQEQETMRWHQHRTTPDLADVGRRWLVEEQPFRSQTPLLGPLIAWVRTKINDLAPRWYVRQILQQQVDFNGAAYRALTTTAVQAQAATLSAEATAGILAEQVEQLSRQQLELAARLKRLEERLAVLDEQGVVRAASEAGERTREAPGPHQSR